MVEKVKVTIRFDKSDTRLTDTPYEDDTRLRSG